MIGKKKKEEEEEKSVLATLNQEDKVTWHMT